MYGLFILIYSVHDNHNLLFYGVPFVWLMVVQAKGRQLAFPRLVLAALIAFQVSYAYPVAGSQSDKAGMFLTLAAVLCLRDSWEINPLLFLNAAATWLASLAMGRLVGPEPEILFLFPLPFICGGILAGGSLFLCCHQLLRDPALPIAWKDFTSRFKRPDRLLAILVLICYLPSISGPLNAYRTAMPLALPGAERLRMPEHQVSCYRWLFHNVRAHTDTFLTLPGLYSLHFWIGVPPPTVDNFTHWFTGLDEKRQWRNLQMLSASPRPGVVRTNAGIQKWLTPDDPFPTPATEQIEKDYRSLGEVGGFALMLRRDRPLSTPTYSAYLLSPESAAQHGGVVKLVLPALTGGRISRLCVCDLEVGRVLADTEESIELQQRGFLCTDSHRQEPASILPVVVSQPVELYLHIPDVEAVRKAVFPVVRLYDLKGVLIESIPFPHTK